MEEKMLKKRLIPIIIVIVVAAGAAGVYFQQRASASSAETIFSGTVEATETNLPTMTGGRVKSVYVNEGDPIHAGQDLVDIYSETAQVNEQIDAPLDGVVLERLVEPNEYAAPGSTVVVLAQLDQLTLTIYVPENRYGEIALGQTYPVTVDSFPAETFHGTVRFIADQAQFTPRNVQTKDSRQTTVYAVKLSLDPTGGKLKPGMPADVHFSEPAQ
jgi:multidrug efflux pump subunit AcrA (membrane-fusion protein)